MISLFYQGGVLFMSIVSLGLISALFFSIYSIIKIYIQKIDDKVSTQQSIDMIKSSGLFAAVTGVLGQLIGLYSAFSAIEQMGSISPEMLMGGLKTSSICTIYGLVIYALSLLAWFVITNLNRAKA
jgi:uncharacterized membrane protein